MGSFNLVLFRSINSTILLFIISFLVLFCSAKSLSSDLNQTDISTNNFHYLKNDSNTLYIFPSNYQAKGNNSKSKRISSYSNGQQSSEYRSVGSLKSVVIPETTGPPEISGRDDGAEAQSTPPPPVAGAIDYVLMPLIILGTAAPIFVMMYVVMGIIEFKLPPNAQLRSINLPETPSSSWGSFFTKAYPYINPTVEFAYETASRALDQDECAEQVSCNIGSFCRGWGMENYFAYEFLDNIILYFFPLAQQRSFRAFLRSIRRKDDDCSLYNCLN